MPKSHRSYLPEFRQQMVELVRSRRRPGHPEPPRVPWHGPVTRGFLQSVRTRGGLSRVLPGPKFRG